MEQSGLFDLNNKKLACIINPFAANKKWKRHLLLRRHIEKALPGNIIDTPSSKQETIQLAHELSQNHDILIVAGGDGTIADVIQGIHKAGKGKEVALGIIPLGSGNAFRKSLGIPKSVKRAIQVISEGKTREIDLIDINGTVATFASVGATAQVTGERYRHDIPGFFGHLMAARILVNLSKKNQKIELIDGIDDLGNRFDHRAFDLKVLDSVIGKTKHFGYGWKIAPRAKIDDGYIDITFFETSGLEYLLFFPSIYFGTFQKTQKHFKAKKVILRGKNLPVQYHGEFLGSKDKVELKILPHAIRVIIPRESTRFIASDL